MNWIKVGDKVRTRRGIVGIVTSIYGEGMVTLDIGNGQIYGGVCIQACTKIEEGEDEDER